MLSIIIVIIIYLLKKFIPFGIFVFVCIFMISVYISFTMSLLILQNLSESINYFREKI